MAGLRAWGPPQAAPQAGAPLATLDVARLKQGTLPVVAEHRYRIAGKIWLLFWTGKDNVGGARIRWRQGGRDESGYDLLIGSDPARAPRRVNRWGFIREEVRPSATTVVGVMKRSDEESLAEAEKNVEREKQGGVFFNMIEATVGGAESVAQVTSAKVARDYSFHELDALLDILAAEKSPPAVRRVKVPAGGRTGLLTSIAELLHDGVEEARRTSRAPGRRSVPYAYYKKQYDLSRGSSSIERNVTYGGVAYPTLLRSSFEIKARGEPWTESFTIVCGLDGPLAEIPVFVIYKPRWWFKIEVVLDERQSF
jgi:hypothetical protein